MQCLEMGLLILMLANFTERTPDPKYSSAKFAYTQIEIDLYSVVSTMCKGTHFAYGVKIYSSE